MTDNYQLFQNFISQELIQNANALIDFALELTKDLINYTEGTTFDNTILKQISKQNKYEDQLILGGGNQTIFVMLFPFEIENFNTIAVKPYKLSINALIHYLASYFYWSKTIKNKSIILDNKEIMVTVTKPFQLIDYDLRIGKLKKSLPILIAEGITSEFDTKQILTRNELSEIVKYLAKANKVSFDAYYSNWQVEKVSYSGDKQIIHVKYVDIFYCEDFTQISQDIMKIKRFFN